MGIELIQVTEENIDKVGFFCKKSKRKTEGWLAKRAWWDPASEAGLQNWIAMDGKRQVGFIEFAPAETSWRAVFAEDHLMVHCLWVVGSAKQQGTGSMLLNVALDEAMCQDRGLAMVTSSKKGWLLGGKLPQKAGLSLVDEAPPCFGLWATPGPRSAPSFPTDWDARAAAFGKGLTLVYTHQCPYVDLVRETYRELAEARGLGFREVHLSTPAEVRERSPSAYGVFSVVKDGELLAWRWEGKKVLDKRLPA